MQPRAAGPVTVAIFAMGGQGGGVLADWIVGVAERCGWHAQSTSVPGVAQRTGATTYYIEMAPADGAGRPVFSLMPVPGHVDVVVAAELIEAGRALQRGFVSAARTTLIASSHRAYAVQEKSAPGDGIVDSGKVLDAARTLSRRFLCFDMAALAEVHGGVISAALLGAVAGSRALPFDRARFEDEIRAGAVGVEASLAVFAAAHDAARRPAAAPRPPAVPPPRPPADAAAPVLQDLVDRIRRDFPVAAQAWLYEGVRRLVDYQDPPYAADYLDRMHALAQLDHDIGGAAHGFVLTVEAARHLAVALSYDDVIRVADLKTRAARFARVRSEVGAGADQVVHITEFMHPRIEELCGTLPAALGRRLEASSFLHRSLGRMIDRGRQVRTSSVPGFLLLHALAGLRRMRRATLRHAREIAHVERWLTLVRQCAGADYRLAVEVLKCRQLVKGYSDTHARGLSGFDRVTEAARRLADRPDAADWVRRLREAERRDPDGKALADTLATIATFARV
ncbi:indolepyruvate oxidoreductase subunit beta family protein [Vineibacter terrae]|uniref:indolepyruvate oxidoreductase subunit beta family protein n=1 Tax=Vineibacter terrae TaxID=2586908 RepID=UPI002E32469E|nr:indolepyruvate oxidoreductase subunit beta family protein [Vineibacter terrae]HEX2889488.1 indolepyruvate oxidoreductase subunit beta family protein [Vineibacter terrae]